LLRRRQAAAASVVAGGAPPATLGFAKMQALGNDFVVLDECELAALVPDWRARTAPLARWLCDRHLAVGADGLIVACAPDRPDCALGWVYVNGDGSASDMCGNGLRCLALWAVERGLARPPAFSIAAAGGPVAVQYLHKGQITVDLGEPVLDSQRIPLAGAPRQPVVREAIDAGGDELAATCLSMGNPHCVIFDPRLPPERFAETAKLIQAMALFPQGVNVEFALAESRAQARVYVWERGCGATLACASGAAAVLVAGVLEGRLERAARIELPGGALAVTWSQEDNRVRLSGPAEESFRGEIPLAGLEPGKEGLR